MESLGQVAVKSKQQGAAVDYRVIAESEGPLSAEDFESVFRELSVGTMSPAAATLGEGAPWITIGSFVSSERHYVAIIRQEWTDRQDVHGRPVVAQYCLCVLDRVLAEQSPSYASLCANIPSQQYFLGTEKQLLADPEVSYEPLAAKVKDILHVINEIGFDFCSYVAALLLVSPVAIMRGQELSVEFRISFFDAVASLLPYGARTDLGVSTWMNNTSVSKIHLGFSDAVLPNQKRVVWLESAPKELESNPVANDYYKYLHKLWNDPQADKEQILSDLASKPTPFSFRNTQNFLKALREVNWEKHVYDDVKTEQGKKEEVRELLKSKKRQKLPQEQVTELLLFLLDEPPLELKDIEILRNNWDDSFWVPACEMVQKELQYPTFQSDALWALCRLSAETGWLEKFIDALLEPEKVTSLTPTLALFYDAIHEFKHDKTRVGYLLLRNPKLVYEMLFMVGGTLETHGELKQMLDWLGNEENSKDADLTAFHIAAGFLDEDASLEAIEALAELDNSYIERLFRIAVTRYYVTKNFLAIWRLTPAVSSWLLGRLSVLKKDEAGKWGEHSRLMPCGPLKSIGLGAQLDLISLALRAKDDCSLMVDSFLKEENVSQIKIYSKEFVHNLSLAKIDSQQIIDRLVGYLDRLSLNSTESSNDMHLVAGLLPKINKENSRNYLITHLSHNITKHPSLIAHEVFEQEITDQLIIWGKERRLLEILQSAFNTAVHNRNPIEQIVKFYIQMWELDMPQIEEHVTVAFSDSNYFDDLGKIECFVESLQGSLAEIAESPELAYDQIRVLQKSLISINSEPMWQYRERHINALIDKLESATELLTLVSDVLDEGQANEVKQLLKNMRQSIPGTGYSIFMGRKRNDKAS